MYPKLSISVTAQFNAYSTKQKILKNIKLFTMILHTKDGFATLQICLYNYRVENSKFYLLLLIIFLNFYEYIHRKPKPVYKHAQI